MSNYYTPYGYGIQNQSNNTFSYVNGIEGAKAFTVQPNQKVMLMDSENPYIYVKQANGQGQCTIKAFQLTEIDVADLMQPKIDLSQYATKTDLEEIKKMIGKIQPIKSEVKNEQSIAKPIQQQRQ